MLLYIAPVTSTAGEPTTHLEWGQYLVDTVDPANNAYGTPSEVYFEGVDGHTESYVYAVCSPLVTALFRQAYDTDFTSWMGCSSPSSYTWNAHISAEDGFTRITRVKDIRPGDVIAIYYADAGCTNLTCGGFETCSSTGHTAVVVSTPVRRTSTTPMVTNTIQYEMLILDSSASYHGSDDTRYAAESDGSNDSGVGIGTMRLYAKPMTGDILGYTWSTSSGSTYYPSAIRPVAVGRPVAP